MLSIRNLHAQIGARKILKGLNLEVRAGEVHAIMGPNGSGKSTLASVLAGRAGYKVTAGTVEYLGQDLLEMAPEERARAGVFLAFQYPVEIPGVNNTYLLKAALNAVRKHLSLVKGGRLGRMTDARGVVLVMSDVIGDDLDTIGSAPLYRDRTTFQDVDEILKKYALWDRLPASVADLVHCGVAGTVEDTPKAPNPQIDHFLVASNIKALEKAKQIALSYGTPTHIVSSRLRGEAREAGKVIAAIAEEIMTSGNPFPPPVCLLFGGETTVTLRGDGRGGRNQEMCLSVVKEMTGRGGWTFLSAGTDGIDGQSDASGAVVDVTTRQRADKQGLSIDEYLARNDSNGFFKQTGDLIVTGSTGTNVMDLAILYIDANT